MYLQFSLFGRIFARTTPGMKKITTLLLAILPFLGLSAQVRTDGETTRIDGMVELDHTVHDFGDVITRSGPLSCTFTVTNISDKPMAITDNAVSRNVFFIL